MSKDTVILEVRAIVERDPESDDEALWEEFCDQVRLLARDVRYVGISVMV